MTERDKVRDASSLGKQAATGMREAAPNFSQQQRLSELPPPRVAGKRRCPNLRRDANLLDHVWTCPSAFIRLDDRTQQIMERSPRMRPPLR
ncbi:hypothetical protein CEXT_755141 [Caerostris extrusa]|uniref:Uncharacterized protein n=1 Tax=Caerostris extrusa TaxID=172846 RepID=A0AAV4UCZ7_CAEEX|nr:hypothetical protein CEXT_755141 [Caerostris extrusa]